MPLFQKKNLKIASKFSLGILVLYILLQFLAIYQTQYQLVSPLIPESTLLLIIKPHIFIGLILTTVTLVSIILYFFEKYLLVIVLAITAILWQQFIPY